jgi:plasmid stabilization system protein ParE
MTLDVAFRPEAELDVLETYDWYERQQTGLGESFVDSVDDTLERIQQMPQMYPVVLAETRRAKTRKFPYVVFYRVRSRSIE